MKHLLLMFLFLLSILAEGQREVSCAGKKDYMLESYFLTWRHAVNHRGIVYKYTKPDNYLTNLDKNLLLQAVSTAKAPDSILDINKWEFLTSRVELYDISKHFNLNLHIDFVDTYDFDIKSLDKKRFEAILFFKNIMIVQYASLGYVAMDVVVFDKEGCNFDRYHASKFKSGRQY